MKNMLKKAVAAVFTLSTVISFAVAPMSVSAAGKELFTDGSFENAELGKTIDVKYGGDLYLPTFSGDGMEGSVTNEAASSGSKSIKATIPKSGGGAGLNFQIQTTAGNYYVVSAKVKADASSAEKFKISSSVNSANSIWNHVEGITASTAWQEIWVADLAARTGNSTVRIQLPPVYSQSKATTAYIDDISVKEYTPSEYAAAMPKKRAVIADDFGGYDVGTVLSDYGTYSSSVTYSVTDEADRDGGARAIKCVINAASANFFKRSIEFKSSKDYRVSAYVKPKSTNSGNIKIYTKVYGADSYTRDLQPSADWTRVDAYVKGSTLSGDTTANFMFQIKGKAGDVFYVDNVTVSETDASDSTNLIYNSGFEFSEDNDDLSEKTYADGNIYKYGMDFFTSGADSIGITDDSHTGSNALVVSGSAPTLFNKVYMKANTLYEVSAYVKAAPENTAPISFYMIDRGWSDKTNRVDISNVTKDNGWHKISMNIFSAKEEIVQVRLAKNSLAGQSFYVDDFKVEEIAEGENAVISGNLIAAQASDFEQNDLSMIKAGDNTKLAPATQKVFTGKRSLLVSSTDAASAQSFSINDIKLEAGKKYVLGAYIGSDNQSGTQDEVDFMLRGDNGNGEPITSQTSTIIPKGASNESDKLYYTSFAFDGADTTAMLNVSYNDNNANSAKNFFIDGLFIKESTETTVADGNLFENGGFEGNVLESYTGVTPSGAKVYVTNKYAKSGNNSLCVDQTAAGGSVTVTLSGKTNQQYNVNCYARWDESKAGMNTVYINDRNGTLKNSVPIGAASGWTNIDMIAKANESGTLTLQIKGFNDSGAIAEKYYIDDLTITEYNPEFTVDSDLLEYSSDGENYVIGSRNNVETGTYRYTVTASNPTAADKSVMAIAALYNADGSLSEIASGAETIGAGETDKKIVASFNVSKAAEGSKIRTFIWEAGTLKPLDNGKIRVLIIGNSITKHEAAPDKGWLGNWGMAATSEENDYVHKLMSSINEKYNNVEFKWENISEFEKYFYDWSKFKSSKYDELAKYDADIIIAAFGANIKNVNNEEDPELETDQVFKASHYSDIIDHFNPNKDAKVISLITTLTPSDNMTVIKESANANGYTIVDVSDLTAREYTAADYKDNSVFADNVIDSVLNHPGDAGMAAMAERLLPAVESAIAAR